MVQFSYATVTKTLKEAAAITKTLKEAAAITKTLKEAAAVCGGVLLWNCYQDLEGGCSCLWWSSPMELLPRP